MSTKEFVGVKADQVRPGDRIRLTTVGGDLHEFNVVGTDRMNDSFWAYAKNGWGYELVGLNVAKLERSIQIPTVPGLYRIPSDGKMTYRGLVLDTRGRWWWYDLTADQIMEELDDYTPSPTLMGDGLALVDPWEQKR